MFQFTCLDYFSYSAIAITDRKRKEIERGKYGSCIYEIHDVCSLYINKNYFLKSLKKEYFSVLQGKLLLFLLCKIGG